jgi:drug/metabolite transporter (DMT)-like permease
VPSTRQQGLLAINLASLIFGSAALYGRLPVSAWWIVAGRSGLAAVSLTGLCWFARRCRPIPAGLGMRVAGSGIALAAHWVLFFAAVQWAGIGTGTLTFATFPLFTLLLRSLQRRQYPPPLQILAAAAIVLAVSALCGGIPRSMERWGAVCGLASAALYAVYWQVSRPLASRLDERWLAALQNALVCLCTAPVAWAVSPVPNSTRIWLCLWVLGTANTAAGLVLYQRALRFLDTATCSAFISLEPIYAVLLARGILGEPLPSATLMTGIVVVAASVVMLHYDRGPAQPAQ